VAVHIQTTEREITMKMRILLNKIALNGTLLTLGILALGAGPTFKSFRIPTDNSQPRDITLGADGNMWFTESQINVSQIGRVDPQGNITEFVVPTRFSQPSDIVSGPDGALWFTAPSGFPDFFIGRVTTDGQFTGFAPECDPQLGCSIAPNGIANGPDGNLWFTERIRNAIVKLTPLGVFTFYTIPTPDANPAGITQGPDGALWFAEFNGNRIGRIDVLGNITEFGGVTGSPDRITAGPDGNLWFTEPFPFDDKIGRITPAGIITEFQLASPSTPRDIVTGPDGNLWFTEYNAGMLARITTDGVVTDVQKVRGGPWGIGRGLGDTIWLTQFDGNRVARFMVGP
jgi:virginiamycin B lyase